MAGVKRVSTANNTLPDDPGLDNLFRFIKASLAGDNSRKRMIHTDKEYTFVVQTELHTGEIERHTVHIAVGQPLYFLRHERDDETNTDQFMVNEGGQGWRINGATGAVRCFNNPIHVVNGREHTMPISAIKYNGSGLSLR